jgi:TetR/AcrR family transcriptional regulator, regulator of cefoperazone and chloramphenicol sensitivity
MSRSRISEVALANSVTNSLQSQRNPDGEIRPTERSNDTRSRILDAAGPVFATQGYAGATVREICSTAGVNIASVGYHFGDKLGLYREVIHDLRLARAKRFPAPNTDLEKPQDTLQALVYTLLARMLTAEESAWETELLMREMQNPTPVFESIVEDFFRPLFDQLTETLRVLVKAELPDHTLQHLAFSTVGQCLYYRVGAQAIQVLIPSRQRQLHYDIDSLSQHITAVMLAACENVSTLQQRIEPSGN